jgi:hypothetical protein
MRVVVVAPSMDEMLEVSSNEQVSLERCREARKEATRNSSMSFHRADAAGERLIRSGVYLKIAKVMETTNTMSVLFGPDAGRCENYADNGSPC